MISQIELHQHVDTEADGIGLAGREPTADAGENLLRMLCEDLRAEGVADRPVIDIGQKALNAGKGAVKILFRAEPNRVQQVFFVKPVGKLVQK